MIMSYTSIRAVFDRPWSDADATSMYYDVLWGCRLKEIWDIWAINFSIRPISNNQLNKQISFIKFTI